MLHVIYVTRYESQVTCYLLLLTGYIRYNYVACYKSYVACYIHNIYGLFSVVFFLNIFQDCIQLRSWPRDVLLSETVYAWQ